MWLVNRIGFVSIRRSGESCTLLRCANFGTSNDCLSEMALLTGVAPLAASSESSLEVDEIGPDLKTCQAGHQVDGQ